MLKYKLVNPTMINGVQYYQIQALRKIGKFIKPYTLGGYVTSEQCLSQTDDSWIHADSIVCDSHISGSVFVGKHCIITDSQIDGKIIIENNCTINNTILLNNHTYYGRVQHDTVIIDKMISLIGTIDNRVTNTSYWHVYQYNNLTVYCGRAFCKSGCVTASYWQMWETLNYQNNVLEQHLQKDFIHTVAYTIPENIEWLKSICKKELNRLNIKIEEGT